MTASLDPPPPKHIAVTLVVVSIFFAVGGGAFALMTSEVMADEYVLEGGNLGSIYREREKSEGQQAYV